MSKKDEHKICYCKNYQCNTPVV